MESPCYDNGGKALSEITRQVRQCILAQLPAVKIQDMETAPMRPYATVVLTPSSVAPLNRSRIAQAVSGELFDHGWTLGDVQAMISTRLMEAEGGRKQDMSTVILQVQLMPLRDQTREKRFRQWWTRCVLLFLAILAYSSFVYFFLVTLSPNFNFSESSSAPPPPPPEPLGQGLTSRGVA